MHTLSPVGLNNRGVVLLEAGRCEDAALCFKKASKMMMSVITQQQTRKCNPSHDPSHENEKNALPSPPPDSTSTLPVSSVDETAKSKGVPQPTSDPCGQPQRKRRRRGTLTSSFPVPTHNLGRPLWIQSKEKRKAPLNSAALSATLLYNLGLSFNMIASKKTNEAAVPVYRRALELYKMSSEIMLRGPVSNAIDSPVFLVALHNMTQVHAVLEEPEAVANCRGRLAHVLRLMAAKRGFSERQYEEFYIKLLSLPKANVLAAAA